jgi:hypothetical protein
MTDGMNPLESPVLPAVGPFLILEIGKLQGVQSSMLLTVNGVNVELRRLSDELEKKFSVSQAAVVQARDDLSHAMDSHSKDDDTRFGKLNRIIWAAGGIFGFLNFVLLMTTLLKMFGVF